MARLPLIANFMLFIALCASLAFWGKQLFTPQSRAAAPPSQLVAAPMPRVEAGAGLFGGPPAGAADASNLQLKGVIAAGPDGVAILSVEGQPPQVVVVGMQAAPGVTVTQVYATYVLLDKGGAIKRIDLPASAKGGLEISPSAPARHANNDRVPRQLPLPPANVYHGLMADQHVALRRPGGMGPPPRVPMAFPGPPAQNPVSTPES
jgi:general secretion pathway protein C